MLPFALQDSTSSPIEENISHELFAGEPAVAKFKVCVTVVMLGIIHTCTALRFQPAFIATP